LIQETNFDYEVLVSEDCSTDGTRQVVLDYASRFPQKVRLLLSEVNVHTNAVVARGIHAARGEYIALLDGDDYWITPHKLQKQVEFLDRNLQCSMCFHNATAVSDNDNCVPRTWTPAEQPSLSSHLDIWRGNFIATCSVMYRKDSISPVPSWYEGFFPITDWPLHILSSQHGSIGYLNEVMGIYRLHSGGLYSSLNEGRKLASTFRFYQAMNTHLGKRYDRIAGEASSKYFYDWAREYLRKGDVRRARYCFRLCLAGRPINQWISATALVRTALALYVVRAGNAPRGPAQREAASPLD
jgi:glycosyltransferase involved in cell wall biosynthesis